MDRCVFSKCYATYNVVAQCLAPSLPFAIRFFGVGVLESSFQSVLLPHLTFNCTN